MDELKLFAGCSAQKLRPFKRPVDLIVDYKYKIEKVTEEATNYGPRIRVETIDFKLDLPERFNRLSDSAKEALFHSAKFLIYKGRETESGLNTHMFDFECTYQNAI